MVTKCVSCRRNVSSGVLCSCCERWFHWGDCSGVGIGEANETLPLFCRVCSRDRIIAEQEGKIRALQADLDRAREELKRLRGEEGKQRWEVVAGNRGHRKRTVSDSFTIGTTNRFALLPQLSKEEAPVEVDVVKMQQNLTRKPTVSKKVDGRRKVLLLGSSHGRGVGQILQEKLGDRYQVTNFFKPSACLSQVVEDIGSLCKDFSKQDHVVIVGGVGNSIDRDQGYSIECDLVKIASATTHTNVGLVPAFVRHDQPQLNRSVRRVNMELDQLRRAATLSDIGLVPVEAIDRGDFTRHGLHLNRKGKGKLAGLLAKSIRGDTSTHGCTSFLD